MKEKNIQELAKRMGLVTVEDMCQYTIAQLVVKIANKVNELVNEVWRFETDVQEIVKTQNENIQYLLGEGLHLEVENIFDGWVQDGTFDTLLNHSALKSVNDRIDETNAQMYEAKQELNSKMEDYIYETNDKIVESSRLRNAHIPYGSLKIPYDFPTLPCNFVKKNNGEVVHDFDFDKYKKGKEIFCASYGVDTGTYSGDGTREKPYKNIARALDDVASSNESNFVIKCLDSYFLRASGPQNKTIDGKTVAIVPDNAENKVYLTSHYANLSWSRDGHTWKATRSGVYSVFYFKKLDAFGLPTPLENKATFDECNNAVGSWYTDDTYVYINTPNGLQPNDTDYCINVSNAHFEPILLNGGKLYIENAVIMHGRSTVSCRITGDESSLKEVFVANNVAFLGGDLRKERKTNVNALSILNVGKTYLFNCISAYGGEDGFNYHYAQVDSNRRRRCVVIEFNCISYNNGIYSTTNTANASTSHNGNSILRINGLYFDCKGPLVNDADGCYSILFDCNASNSLATSQVQRSAFRFDNDGQSDGKAILVNCNGGGMDTYSCYSGDDLEITLQAFKGTKFTENFKYKIQD